MDRAARIVCECGATVGHLEVDTDDPTTAQIVLARRDRAGMPKWLIERDFDTVIGALARQNQQESMTPVLTGCPRCRRILLIHRAEMSEVAHAHRAGTRLRDVTAHPQEFP